MIIPREIAGQIQTEYFNKENGIHEWRGFKAALEAFAPWASVVMVKYKSTVHYGVESVQVEYYLDEKQ